MSRANRGAKRPVNPNRELSVLEVLDAIVEYDAEHAGTGLRSDAKVVGTWVWVEFEKRPEADVRDFLRFMGFHWNRKRQAWQHPCGSKVRARGGYPKLKYGARSVEDVLHVAG